MLMCTPYYGELRRDSLVTHLEIFVLVYSVGMYSVDRAVINRVMPLGSEPQSIQFHARGAIKPSGSGTIRLVQVYREIQGPLGIM